VRIIIFDKWITIPTLLIIFEIENRYQGGHAIAAEYFHKHIKKNAK
jgi:hypothetical protein